MTLPTREITARIAATLPAGDRLRVSDLLDSVARLPVVSGFLEMELEVAVASDLDQLKTHFELPLDLEVHAYQSLHIGLLRLATVSRADALRLLTQAVRDALEYLITPRKMLERILLADDEIELDPSFFHALGYFREFVYFPELLRMRAERLRIDGHDAISSEDFRGLLRRIDRGMIAEHSLERIEELLAPLAVLVNGAIPREVLAEFFRAKDMHRVAATIQSDTRARIAVREVPTILLHVLEAPRSQKADQDAFDRNRMLQELREAGVVLTPSHDPRLIRDIEGRTAMSAEGPPTPPRATNI